MMIDQDLVRLWADHHFTFTRWARDAAHQVGDAFRVLARVQYDRPWARELPQRQAAEPAQESGCTRH